MRYLNRFFQPETWREDHFTSDQGRKIRYGHAEPVAEKKGTVIITTGYADFMESYHETVHEYLDRGYAVWMMDWAGQGGSDKQRGGNIKAQRVDDHVADLRKFRHDIVEAQAGKPVFLSTHSLGGQVALQYFLKHDRDFDFAILAAPMVDLNLGCLSRKILQAAFKAAVDFGFGDQPIDGGRRGITRQILAERKKRASEDPVRMDLHRTFFLMNRQLRAEDPTFALLDSLFESTARLGEKALSGIKTHVLLGVAGDDDVVDNEAIFNALERMPNALLAIVEKAKHNLWHEPEQRRLEWWNFVDGFLQEQHERLAPLAPFIETPPHSPQKPKGPHP